MNERFILHDQRIKNNLIDYVSNEVPFEPLHEVIIQEVKKDKTMKQLGGLFGVWIKHLSKEMGESEDVIHNEFKQKFLARIYVSDPQGELQEQWTELLFHYQQLGDMEKLENHAKRISLAWASINQMNEYMSAIENHCISIGHPLPILDKFRKAYKR